MVDREELLEQIMDGIEGYIGTQSATYIDYYVVIDAVLRKWARQNTGV